MTNLWVEWRNALIQQWAEALCPWLKLHTPSQSLMSDYIKVLYDLLVRAGLYDWELPDEFEAE